MNQRNWTKLGNYIEEYVKGVTPKYVTKSNTIVLNQKCIRNNIIDYSFAQFIDDDQYITSNKYLQEGDLLLCSTGQGSAGRCAYVSKLPENYNVTIDSHILVCRCTSKNIAICLSNILYSNEKMIMEFLIGSSGQAELDRVRVFNIQVTLPQNRKELNQIALLNENLKNKISLNNRINEELESMAKTLYDYWFVQFDFPNEEGKPYKSSGGKMVWNEKLKREIPEGWEVKELSNLITIINDTIEPFQNPDEQYKYYSIPIYDATHTYQMEKGEKILSNKYLVRSSDILVSKLNPWTSRVIWAQDLEKQICSTEFVIWQTNNNYLKTFLYYTAKNRSFIDFCVKSSSGTSHSHRRITPQVMIKYQQVYNSEIIKHFGKKLLPLIKKQLKIIEENQHLSSLRDWLLPVLMNGQVTIREDANTSDNPSTATAS